MNMPRISWESKVNLGHVLVAISIAGSVVGFILSWGGKITMLEAQAAQQSKVDEKQDQQSRERYEALRQDIKELGEKVDRILERRR